MLSNLLSSLLFVGCLVAVARSTCNVCNSVNQMACSSMTKSRACDANNLPTGEEYDCPPGYMCVSGSCGAVCQPRNSSDHVAACEDCNKCDVSRTFACTGPNRFALCLGSNEPKEFEGTCASGYVCNSENSQICELATSVNPSCSFAETTTTTTIPPTATPQAALDAICEIKKKHGYFPVGNDPETTCREFVQCYPYGKWLGSGRICKPNTYWNEISKGCEAAIPARCYCDKVQQEDTFPVGTNSSSTCRQYIDCIYKYNVWSGQKHTCEENLYYNSATKTCVPTLPATCSNLIKSISFNGMNLG